MLNKRYDYCCLACYHMWRTSKKYTHCPKCKSTKLDIKEEVVL